MIIKRVSHKKVHIKSTIKIYCGQKEVGEKIIKWHYKYGTDYSYPQVLPPKDIFYRQLSQNYGIKRKFIVICTKPINVHFEDKDIIFSHFPDFILFNDVSWFTSYSRNKILNNLLS